MDKQQDVYDLMGIEPVDKRKEVTVAEELTPMVVIEDTADQDSFDADFEEARKNLLYVIENAKEALEDVHLIAKEKEGAAEYSTFNQLLRTVGDASGNLLKYHQARKKFKEKATKKEEMKNGIAVNNAVIVGSSSDLRKMLRGED